jgi:hypothetical protein
MIEKIAYIYLAIGGLVAILPMIHPTSGKKYDEMPTGSMIVGSLIIGLFWPLVIIIGFLNVAKGKPHEKI